MLLDSVMLDGYIYTEGESWVLRGSGSQWGFQPAQGPWIQMT